MRDHGRAAVAQLVEQRTFNPKVVGSSPTGGIGPVTFPEAGEGVHTMGLSPAPMV